MEPFDFGLRRLDGLRDHAVFNRLILRNAEGFHHGFNPIRPEDAHKIILQRKIKLGEARIALASRAPPELIVNAPGLMPLGTENVKTSFLLYYSCVIQVWRIPAKNYVDAAPSEVCRNRYRALLPGLGNNRSFLFVVLGV